MNKTKWMANAVVLSLLVGAASACGSAGNENEDGAVKGEASKELSIAVFEGGYGKAYWEEVIKSFEKDHPGVKVKLTSNPKVMDVIKPQIVAGNPPDFIYAPLSEPSGTIRSMISEKAFLDVTDVFEGKAPDQEGALKDQMLDGILDYAKPYGDGKIYMAPNYISTLGLWYNKTLFKQKGWEAPKTWDEFMALGEKAKADGRALFTYPGINPAYNEGVLWPAVASAGGTELIKKIENYEEGAYKEEGVRQAFSVYDAIAQKGYLLKGTVALNHTQSQTEFLKGKALFVPNGNWFEGEMKDAPREEGFEFGFLAPPVFKEGEQRYAMTSFEGLFIPAKAKNPDLAKEFMKYQYKEENVRLSAKLSGAVMAVKNGAEIAKEFVPASVYESVKVLEQDVKPLMFQWKVTPKTEVKIKDDVFQPIGRVMNKEMTVDQWIDRLEQSDAKLRDVIAKAAK
ncbi:carbohydrate ABC transporter substrate-binding protein [Paenibacillus sp. FJAT-26967]|uniref:carbohydrate ABC transporter substrate-binding protein n=1 Tax=Paenibacillus sp. FJAT-26967 TaxID=1729690 RepID=UPI0008391967|nr:carbohydrate ABC transporter substrate-binding protein [Paenibacillus sp. FJAT-26967]